MKPLVLYHASCADGFCAAWIFRRYYCADCDFVPVQYGDDPPDVEGRRVFVLDFSFRRPVLEDMIKRASSVLVLDHHTTAQDELKGFPYCVFDMEKSGARLTSEWTGEAIFTPLRPNWLVDYTEDRDLWRWALPDSREVSAALMSYPRDFETWDKIYEGGKDALVPEGKAILRYQAQVVKTAVENAYEMVIGGHKVLAVNSTVLVSEIAQELAKGRPFGCAYFVLAGGKVVHSLRSAPEGVDVAEIAKSLGGGGHRHAAGFTIGSE